MEQGDQMELDVLGIHSTAETQIVYGCEVITHLDGTVYSGTPSNDQWSDFGNRGYQYTLERIGEKFVRDTKFLEEVFDEADEIVLQLWSPYISKRHLTNGLAKLATQHTEAYDFKVELIINDVYTDCITELRERARQTTKDFGEVGFRYLQIIENLR